MCRTHVLQKCVRGRGDSTNVDWSPIWAALPPIAVAHTRLAQTASQWDEWREELGATLLCEGGKERWAAGGNGHGIDEEGYHLILL